MAVTRSILTVQEQVVDQLRGLILEGDLLPGAKLQQDELAERLGVSAMPVREGLRRLQAEGLVDFVPRHGAFVTRLTPEEFDELYHMREELEVLAIHWAVGRMGRAEALRLHGLVSQIELAEAGHLPSQRSALVRDFLWSIFRAAGRRHLFDAIRRYYNMTYLYQRQYSAVFDVSASRLAIYRRLAEALLAGDAAAAAAAHRDTYRLVRETMLPLMGDAFPTS
jgi:DNA-binding GntR family transcriptional regulator